MVYTKLTVRAMQIAYQAHHGQVDKAGVPYVLHPVHLAEGMEDEVSACVALLHDVVEDTEWTFAMLEAEFPPAVTDALRLLTHADEEPYMDYVRRIKGNAVARRVKIADLKHNSDQTRFAGQPVSEEKLAYFRVKYAEPLRYLTED